MKKKMPYFWVLLFVAALILPQCIFALVGDYIPTSNYEQRVLAEKPEFEVAKIEKYPAAYEEYYNDNLPFRTQLIEVNSLLNYYCFSQSPVEKVVCGKDGWLFYNPKGADGDNMGDFQGETLYTQKELEQFAKHLVKVRDDLEKQGREFVFFVAPNKETIYGEEYLSEEYLPKAKQTKAEQVVSYLKENTDLRVVYPQDEMKAVMQQYPQYEIYYKLDTHWNELGGYIGGKALLEELGITLPEISKLQIVDAETEATKDLAGMMGLSKYLNEKYHYSVGGFSDTVVTGDVWDFATEFRYYSDSPNKEKIMIVRDSFGTLLAPTVVTQYAETYMPHRAYYQPSMLETENPDVVVYEAAERYIDMTIHFTATK